MSQTTTPAETERRGPSPQRIQWRAARRWTTALVVAAFPFLFILDERGQFGTSPVIPGLIILTLALILLPMIWVEAARAADRRRRREGSLDVERAERSLRWSRTALILSAVWLVLWFAIGT